MISFYPGPSRIHDAIPRYVKDAAKEGILSMNHRSEGFMQLAKTCDKLLKQKLSIPKDYTILYTSSATECWEIIAQSLITKNSYHFFNGAFGKKWFDYTVAINKNTTAISFDREEILTTDNTLSIPAQSVICLTQNETSNGTQLNTTTLKSFRNTYPDAIIAVDATSSMGGIKLDYACADVWFASVQKCFGLPAGLALLICSPKAIDQIQSIQEKGHYNSLTNMVSMMKKWQTTHTPNVMGIYLLMRVMKDSPSIAVVHKQTIARYNAWKLFLTKCNGIGILVKNEKVRSHTVIPLTGETAYIQKVKNAAKKAGILLGEGYGDLKEITFRVANFPAIREREIVKLKKVLSAL